MGATFFDDHADRKALIAAVQGRGQSDLKLLAVTVLTNFDGNDLRDIGMRSVRDLVTAPGHVGGRAGCDGVVASGEEPEAIRAKVGPNLLIVTPGVRPAAMLLMITRAHDTDSNHLPPGADYPGDRASHS